MKQDIIIVEQLERSLGEAAARVKHDRLFCLTDETTLRLCWPKVQKMSAMQGAKVITIGAGDEHKTLESLAHVWTELQKGGATRHSLLVNLGGGMVTDLGGFAASTFKRGLAFINVPTTLLSQVDASVGGKTGINFGGLKNEVGVFSDARSVLIATDFLDTLDDENILSGYAEMLKHGLLDSEEHWAALMQDPFGVRERQRGSDLIARSIAVKERIVTEDPTEKGLRKALNLGHTVGHALESLALRRGKPVLHGYAVAWGLIAELWLSAVKEQFPTEKLHQTVRFIREHYGRMNITCDDYPELLELMTHDKKNEADSINFTLLGGIGDIRINRQATTSEIYESLDFYRES